MVVVKFLDNCEMQELTPYVQYNKPNSLEDLLSRQPFTNQFNNVITYGYSGEKMKTVKLKRTKLFFKELNQKNRGKINSLLTFIDTLDISNAQEYKTFLCILAHIMVAKNAAIISQNSHKKKENSKKWQKLINQKFNANESHVAVERYQGYTGPGITSNRNQIQTKCKLLEAVLAINDNPNLDLIEAGIFNQVVNEVLPQQHIMPKESKKLGKKIKV